MVGRRLPAGHRVARRDGGAVVTTHRELVATATIGLAQRPLSITELAAPVGDRARVLDGDEAAALLDAAALFDAARRAGRLTPVPVRLPAPAEPDSAPQLTAVANAIVEELLRTGPL